MNRQYTAYLEELLTFFPCVAIIGPRQCGKTTFLKELPSDWIFFDLEKRADYQTITRDPDLFLRLNPSKIVIDEAQIAPELFSALRVAIDSDRNTKGRFIITGSSSPNLLKNVSESLAGRIGIIEMAPLSFAEVSNVQKVTFFDLLKNSGPKANDFLELSVTNTVSASHEYWLHGGYPEPWLSKNSRFREQWSEAYFRTYVERDVSRLFPGLNFVRFKQFVQMLAGLSGSIINYSEIGRDIGTSFLTIREYFEIAHGTFLWRTIPCYHKKVSKRIVKHPRGHLRDSGLLHHLLKLKDLNSLLSHPQMGRSWESVVIEEILRGLSCRGISHDYSYYRTHAGAEVDLVLEGAFGLLPIEIKYTQSVDTRSLRALTDFIEENGSPFGIVINNDESVRKLTDKIIGVPFLAL